MKSLYKPTSATIKSLVVFFFLLFHFQLQAQDSLATVYFYRNGKFAESFAGYEIKSNGAAIGRINSKNIITYRTKPGDKLFSATTESESAYRLTVEAGKTYFIECGISVGLEVSRPTFRQASRVEAMTEIAKIDSAVANTILSATLQSQIRDSLATVYFYRGGQVAGFAISYNIKLGEKIIGRMGVNSAVMYRAKPGAQVFVAKTEGESSIHLNLEAGKTYFVECGLAMGALAGRPTFRQTFSEVARKKITSIDPTIAESIPEYLPEVIQQSDTTRALQNLFQRKRKGGTARAVVFGTLGIISLISTTKSQTVNAGGQNVDVSSDNTGAYLFFGLSAIMCGTGIAQTSSYSSEKLDILLKDYGKGVVLPVKIKSKLKKKDFK